jgi:uncharacterized protein
MSGKNRPEPKFLIDRMLGTLGRYLRFMGYDTVSANTFPSGNDREDSLLLEIAVREDRLLLTRDRDLARRGGDQAFFISPVGVFQQLQELIDSGFIEPRLKMNRCSLCNQKLRRARTAEIRSSLYAPERRAGHTFFWCTHCRKLYWTGSHAEDIADRLKKGVKSPSS